MAVTATGDRERGRGWLLVGGSLLALPVGIGAGLRGLRAGDMSVATVVGVLVFVAGVMALVVGLWRVLSGRSVWARLGIGALMVLGVALVVWTLTPSVIAAYVPEIEHSGASPDQYGMDADEVTFAASDGAESWAWYVPSANGATVIVRHGSGSTASAVLPHAGVLVENGYGVLLTDARGHGNSGGQGMDFGWFGDADIEAAVDFLFDQTEPAPRAVAVLGLSMGGEEAIGAIGHDPRIAAVVAEGASARTEADKAWLSEVYGWRGWVQERLEWLQYALADLLTPASKPDSLATAARIANPRPLLLIAGGDMPDEVHAAEFISAGLPNVETWVVPSAGHTEGLATEPDEWERVVIGFLDAELGVDG